MASVSTFLIIVASGRITVMKKFVLISFLIFSYSYAYAKPPFDGLHDLGVNIITPKHPTSLVEIKYIGEENRNMVIGGWPIEKRQAYVFHAFYDNRSISDPLAQGNGLIVHLPDRGKLQKISPLENERGNCPTIPKSGQMLDKGKDVIGFKFLGESYLKVLSNRNEYATEDGSGIIGCYMRLPIENAWHTGSIYFDGKQLKWKNAAGASWNLKADFKNNKLITSNDNPYADYNDPHFNLLFSDRGKFQKISPAEKECEAHYCTEILIYYHKPKSSNLKRAKKIAKQYAIALGQMPNILQRHLLDGIHIFGRPSSLDEIGGTNAQTWRKTVYIREEGDNPKYLEEILMHELAHIFLGKVGHSPYTNLNERIVRKDITDEYNINLEEWAKAQRKDNEYITNHAKTSLAEDLAETFHYWMALRYKKISKSDASKTLKTIPNRIQFLDDQYFDMYPLAPKK